MTKTEARLEKLEQDYKTLHEYLVHYNFLIMLGETIIAPDPPKPIDIPEYDDD